MLARCLICAVCSLREFGERLQTRLGAVPRRSVRTDEKAEAWNEAVLDNGAEPGTVWKIPGISPDQVPGVRRR